LSKQLKLPNTFDIATIHPAGSRSWIYKRFSSARQVRLSS